MRQLSILALFVVLSSCASAPSLDYYTVDMSPSGAGGASANLAVGRFVVSDKLDRHQIVIQESPTRIAYYATDRWASSIGEMVEQKLAAEFGPVDGARRSLIVDGRIVAFEQVDTAAGPVAKAALDVIVRDGASKRYEAPLLEKSYTVERPASEDSVDAVVRALSRALETIAAEIASDAAGL